MKHPVLTLYCVGVLAICFGNCMRFNAGAKTRTVARMYEGAVARHERGNLNDALYHYQRTALACHNSAADSTAFWWRAMCGQADIWMQKNFPDDAEADYRDILAFAISHKIDTAEFVASRRLAHLCLLRGNYADAQQHIARSLQIATERGYPETTTKGLEHENTLAEAGRQLTAGHLSQPLALRLEQLSADANGLPEHRLCALRLLAAHDSSFLPSYLQSQEKFWEDRFKDFTDESEREKKGLVAERDAIAASREQSTFSTLTLVALLLAGGLYALARHHRQQEMTHIMSLLDQKELELREKEQRMEQHKPQEPNDAESGNGEDLSQILCKVERLQLQLEQKQNEWRATETQIRRHHLYDMEIGSLLPAPDNPRTVKMEQFENLLANPSRQEKFLKEMNHCFEHFATELKSLTPGLTDEEAVYCCLFRLDIRTKDIAMLMTTSRSNVSQKRKRIGAKMSKGNDATAGET